MENWILFGEDLNIHAVTQQIETQSLCVGIIDIKPYGMQCFDLDCVSAYGGRNPIY